MLILDTHVLIWLVNGDERMRKSGFLPSIDRALKDSSIVVPAISLWEIAMLSSKGRIVLAGNTIDWIKNATSAPGINVHPLSPEVAFESTVLPGVFHQDPADRMIIATARITDGILLTFDKAIMEYAKLGFVKTMSPGSAS